MLKSANKLLLAFLVLAVPAFAQLKATGGVTMSGGVTIPPTPSGGGSTLIPAALGWYQIPNSTVNTLCTPLNEAHPEITGQTGCAAIESAWGTGYFDSLRQTYCVSGGGHNDYYGNEIYCLDMKTLTLSIVHQPTVNPNLGTITTNTETYANGDMSSRHGFSSNWYLPQFDYYFIFGQGIPNIGNHTDKYYNYSRISDSYTPFTAPGTAPSPNSCNSQPASGYDYATGKYYLLLNNCPQGWIYTPGANTWINPATWTSICDSKTNPAGVVDPVHRLFIVAGQGCFASFNLDSPYNRVVNAVPASCSTPFSQTGVGLDFDEGSNTVGVWAGGNTFYNYDSVSNTCTPTTFTGGPGTILLQGTRNLLQYDVADGVHLLGNGTNIPMYSLRLNNQQTLANADFAARCAASGVIVCRNLSTSADLTPGVYSFPNPNPNVALNCTTYTSGGCSTEFTITANGSANTSGTLTYPFSASGTEVGQVNFGQNSDFWVQYRISFDAPYLTQTYKDGSGTKTYQKLSIFHWEDFPTKNSSTCGQIEATIIYPNPFEMYGQCGADLYAPPFAGGTNFLLESGTKSTALGDAYDQGYNYNYLAPHGTGIQPQANTWYTIKVHIHVGTFGVKNSHIDAYWSAPGGEARQFINYTTTMNQDSPTINAYNAVSLLPYMTNRSSSFPVPLAAHVRYNELIVSSSDIANPLGPIGQP